MSPQAVSESTKFDLCDAYEAARGPFTVSVEGQEGFIVMRPSDFDGFEPDLTEDELCVLERGYAEALRGEARDAFESLAEIRAKYGL